MKNTIYLNADFDFMLLECEETDLPGETKIYINVTTSEAANQRFEISVAGEAPVTKYIAAGSNVNFELTQEYWADDDITTITPKNNDGTGATLSIVFPAAFNTGAALNYVTDTRFDIQAQSEQYAEEGSGGSGGSSSGSGSGGSIIDFAETIRNIGFRLLDEPSNVNIFYDEDQKQISIKWDDPGDINTNEPAPAYWAGTVVVRKEGSPPRNKWDGDIIADSTTRNEYSSNALIDENIEIGINYFYGIFPYDTKGDYRFTKIVSVQKTQEPTGDWTCDPAYSTEGNGTRIAQYSAANRSYFKYDSPKAICVCAYPSTRFYGPILLSDSPNGVSYYYDTLDSSHIIMPHAIQRVTIDDKTWYISNFGAWIEGTNIRNISNTPEVDLTSYPLLQQYTHAYDNLPAEYFTELTNFVNAVLTSANYTHN